MRVVHRIALALSAIALASCSDSTSAPILAPDAPNDATMLAASAQVTATEIPSNWGSPPGGFSASGAASEPSAQPNVLVFGTYYSRSSAVAELQSLGASVTLADALPADLAPFDAIWMVTAFSTISASDRAQLIAFIKDGNGVYLTGERPCCEELNTSVELLVNEIVAGGGISVGGIGDIGSSSNLFPFNSTAVGGITTTPHAIANWSPSASGGMVGVAPANVLSASNTGTPVAAAWDGAQLVGGAGRLVVMMDVNWFSSLGSASNKFALANIHQFLLMAPGGVPADVTAPVIVGTVTGTRSSTDWYTSDATVSWTVTDGESAVTSPACAPTTISSESTGTTVTCSATSAGGTASSTVTVRVDKSAPTVSSIVTGTLGNNGWYTSDVSVSWTTVDEISGASPCAAGTRSTDGSQTFTCTSTNGAGLQASDELTVKRDATAPVIAYAGNSGTYSVDQSIAITCSASDNLSGLVADSCASISGAGYTFALGNNAFSASAEDAAGNTSSAATSFTVTVSSANLCTLVERWVSNRGIANSMCVKLSKGNYEPFKHELSAQSGKSISDANAAILLRLVSTL